MIKGFSSDAGIFVLDAYWIGSIGHHASAVANLVWRKCALDVSQAQAVTNITKARTTRHQHPAKFSSEDLNLSVDEFNALVSLPGINELIQENVDTNDTVDVGYMASDWIESSDSPHNDEHSPGSLIVCLQAPRGCILTSGDVTMEIRKGDVVLLNNTHNYSLMQKAVHSLKPKSTPEQLEWLKNDGMLLMTINRRAK